MSKRSARSRGPSGAWLVLALIAIAVAGLLYRTHQASERGDVAGSETINAPESNVAKSTDEYLGGLPISTSAESQFHVLKNPGFVIGYNEARKNPGWVYYKLFFVPKPENLVPPGDFQRDERTFAGVVSDDFLKSGYDRGHMAPNDAISDCYGEEAQRATFLLSNVVPQKPGLNRGIWKHLESLITKHYTRRAPEVWVVTGPIFSANPETLKGGVQVPDRCYKIIVEQVHGKYRALAFEVPQSATLHDDVAKYLASIRHVEAATQLNFFPSLDQVIQDALETPVATSVWPKVDGKD